MIYKTNRKAAVISLGCKVSKYEADAMAELLKFDGYEIVDFDGYADVFIINTCTVTNVADKKSRKMIRQAKKLNEDAIVVVSGCYSQIRPDEVAQMDGVNIILGSKNQKDICEILDEYISGGDFDKQEIAVSDISKEREFEKISLSKNRDRTRAYIKIEDGCDNFCSYCIIPYARGRVRSKRTEDILQEARQIVSSGVKEIVLTGIHVGSYGKDLIDHSRENLEKLVSAVSEIPNLERIRLSSLEPMTITEQFINSLKANPKFCDHFHLSLQSGCDKTLKAMNRHYTSTQYNDAVNLIKSSFPKASIWTDVIVGFPGETEKDFAETCTFVETSGISKLHIFPYSPKKGTKACEFPNQISAAEKNRRAKTLGKIDEELYKSFLLENLGETMPVLFEKQDGDGLFCGHTKNYIYVKAESGSENEIKNVTLLKMIEKCNIFGAISD